MNKKSLFEKKVFLRKLVALMNSVAMCLAVLSINTTCVWVHHQPRVPETLKRKIEENENCKQIN